MSTPSQFFEQITKIWSAAPIKVVREITFLIISVWVPPVVFMTLLWRSNKFDDVFVDSVYCLIIGLVWHHAALYARRSTSTNNIIRYIDYIYLTYAALSLLSAADSTVRRYKDDLASVIRQTQQDLSEFGSRHKTDVAIACANEVDQKDCQVFQKLLLVSAHDALVLKVAPNFENLAKALDEMVRLADNSSFVENSENYYETNIYEDDYQYKYLAAAPFGANTDDFYHPRQLAYLFLASAIALRIARVSVELGRWWKT